MNNKIIDSIEVYVNQYISRLAYKNHKEEVFEKVFDRLVKQLKKIKRGK